MASRRPQRIPAHWYRRRALTSFHRVVKGIAIRNVNKRAAAPELRQLTNCGPLSLRAEHQAQRRFHEIGHGSALTGGLALEFRHHGVVDIKRSLHTENHIIYMAVRLALMLV